MRILMLGNSYTFYNDMPQMVAELTGAEVVQHTRGGARLSEQLNPETGMGAKTLKALAEEKWDYVVLQEMSNAPVTTKDKFMESVSALCEKIQANGAKPVLYVTWAYKKNGDQLRRSGLDYVEMYHGMQTSYREAATLNKALLADVGTEFYERSWTENLYEKDGSHPNEEGSRIAARIIAETIMNDWRDGNAHEV